MSFLQKIDTQKRAPLHALLRQSSAATLICLIFSATAFAETEKEKAEKAAKELKLKEEKEWELRWEEREKQRELDKQLTQQVRDALTLNSNLFHAFIEVKVEDRVATLSGRVLSDREEEMARLTALGVVGIRSVKMRVMVKPLTAADAEEVNKLRGKTPLESRTPTPFPSASPQKANPKSGYIFPTGFSTPAERMRDQQQQAQEDARIRREAEFAIQMEAGAPRTRSIYVTVLDGVVTLTGVAESRNDRFDIENAVRRIRGVKRISNQMIVR